MYRKYKSAVEDLAMSRKTSTFLVPINTGKGWHPAFDPEATEEVTALADEIKQKKETLESVTQAINEFVVIADGPSLQLLEDKLATARRSLVMQNIKAKNATSLATNQNRHKSPAEIQDLLEVVTANAALAEARPKLEAEIADLKARLQKPRAILEKTL